MNVGSLFTGIRGLDLGLEAHGHRTIWACENDEACQRVIARTLPGVPIIGDVREIDAGLPQVDILAGGFPCPDFSVAGRRLMFEGDRAKLWFEFARAIRLLRPRHVIVENVPGLLAALGVVLADLAEAGYMGEWLCLRAADVGAPHRRERVFIVATAADADDAGPSRARSEREHRAGAATDAERMAGPETGELDGGPRAGGERRTRQGTGQTSPISRAPGRARRGGEAPPDTDRAGRFGEQEPPRIEGASGSEPLGRGQIRQLEHAQEAPADTDGERAEPRSRRGAASGDHARRESAERDRDRHDGPAEPRPHTAAADTGSERGQGPAPLRPEQPEPVRPEPENLGQVDWGAYGPAVTRWEHILGRAASRPTDDRGRLNPAFVEWMLGFDDGWTAGETRTARLRMLGNAVQVQVAEQIGAMLNG